jgi:hypothetical protein
MKNRALKTEPTCSSETPLHCITEDKTVRHFLSPILGSHGHSRGALSASRFTTKGGAPSFSRTLVSTYRSSPCHNAGDTGRIIFSPLCDFSFLCSWSQFYADCLRIILTRLIWRIRGMKTHVERGVTDRGKGRRGVVSNATFNWTQRYFHPPSPSFQCS